MPLAEAVTELPAGATLTYTVTAVVAEEPPGEIVNVAMVDGPITCENDPITTPPCEDEVAVVVAQPSLALVKSAEVVGGAGPVADAGDIIEYLFVVSNTGNVTMSDVAVDDPLPGVSTVVCPVDTLAPGESMTCTASYTVTQADVDAGGSVENVATASGVPPGGDPGDPDDRVASPPSEVAVPLVDPAPALELEKLADANGASDPGDEISYRFVVTNAGNVTLTGVAVEDPKLGSVTCPVTVLGPGDSVTCTGDAPYVVTAADAEAGEVVNVATATADGPEATSEVAVRSGAAVVVTRLGDLPATGAGLVGLLLAGAGLLLTGAGLVSGGLGRPGPNSRPPAGGSRADAARPRGATATEPARPPVRYGGRPSPAAVWGVPSG